MNVHDNTYSWRIMILHIPYQGLIWLAKYDMQWKTHKQLAVLKIYLSLNIYLISGHIITNKTHQSRIIYAPIIKKIGYANKK